MALKSLEVSAPLQWLAYQEECSVILNTVKKNKQTQNKNANPQIKKVILPCWFFFL